MKSITLTLALLIATVSFVQAAAEEKKDHNQPQNVVAEMDESEPLPEEDGKTQGR